MKANALVFTTLHSLQYGRMKNSDLARARSLFAITVCLAASGYLKKPRKSKRKTWVKSWMARKERSVYNNLVAEMLLDDTQGFFDLHRMPKECFNELLQLVSPLIEKQDTKLRKAIPAQQRLSVTLRYLATGKAFDLGSVLHPLLVF